MPFGYSYLEVFKVKEKGRFLRKHMNPVETKLFITFYILTQFVLLFFILSILISKELRYVSFALLCFHAIITQNFRRFMYVKYDYNKRPSKVKTILLNLFLLIGFFVSISFLLGFSIFNP